MARSEMIWTIWAALFLTSCLSLAQRINQRTDEKDFTGARELLSGAAPSEEVDSARARFTYAVEKDFGEKSEALTDKGLLPEAARSLREGLAIAPWSMVLKDSIATLDSKMESLQEMERDLAEADVSAPSGARQFLTAIRPLGNAWKSSASLSAKRKNARATIRKAIQTQLAAKTVDAAILMSDALLAGASGDKCLMAVAHLSGETDAIASLPEIENCAGAREKSDISEGARGWVDRWTRENLPRATEAYDHSFEALGKIEAFRASVLAESWKEFDCALARAHIARASKRAGMGLGAVTALAHIERARDLCGELASIAETQARALATLSKEKPVAIDFTIDADPRAEPQAYSMARTALISTIRARTLPHVSWQFARIGSSEGSNSINLRTVDFLVPSAEQLQAVSSRYFSHSEQVPNPERQRLRYQLSLEEIDVEYAESALKRAISSHNISPSEWSLQNVNQARRKYLAALDAHNGLVQTYNATPTTVSQPVYRPYEFAQGTVRNGWAFDFSYAVEDKKGQGRARAIDSAFVRFGTNYADARPEFRRDVLPNIDLSVERLLVLLIQATEQILATVGPKMGDLVRVPGGLEPGEVALTQWLLHPWGPKKEFAPSGQIQEWAMQVASRARLPERSVAPPKTRVAAYQPAASTSVEALARKARGLVGRILLPGGHATGAVVSADGLILTCAHCVEAGPERIRFTEAPWAGDYPVEVLFVDSSDDVALIRAIGLKTPRWLDIRLETSASKGESVAAIGNMSLSTDSSTEAGITLGVVSDPKVDLGGAQRLIADIAIASGSSGGPILGLSDGRIVGVTTQVLQFGFFEGRAQSRTVAGAFPASLLGVAIGLSR